MDQTRLASLALSPRTAAASRISNQSKTAPGAHKPLLSEDADAWSNQHQEARTRPLSKRDTSSQCAVAVSDEEPATGADSRLPLRAGAGAVAAADAISPVVVVLRRCEGPRVRTSGFQRIEEEAQRRPSAMVNEKSVEPLEAIAPAHSAAPVLLKSVDPIAPTTPTKAHTINNSNNNNSSYEHELDADAEAEATLRNFVLGLKQQADQLMRAERFKDALPLYRDLLMHLSKSHVRLLQERELVVSCRMNVLGAMSKLQQWSLIPAEATTTMQVIVELERASKASNVLVPKALGPEASASNDNNPSDDHSNAGADRTHLSMVVDALTRVHFFRGYAHFRLGSFATADADFRKAMELSPGDASFQDEYKQLQTAMRCEKRVKDLLNVARQHFQAGKPKVSIDCSLEALRECQVLQKDDFTGLVHGNLAAAYSKVGDDVKAIEHYKRALAFARAKSASLAAAKLPAAHVAAQNERVYDLLSALAACYSRRNDFSSAHSVILDAIALFPSCPARVDLEAHLYLNAGRVAFTLHKYTDAEIFLIKAETAARKFSQLALALQALLWLSKACRQLGKDEQTVKVLDKAIALCDASGSDHAELHAQLLLAKLDLLDPATNAKFKLVEYARESALWRMLEHFEAKQDVRGHLRASQVLVRVLCEEPPSDIVRNKLERVLFVVDRADVRKLSTKDDVATLVALVLAKVDLLVTTSDAAKAQAVLVATLTALPRVQDAFTQKQRSLLLKRFAELFDPATLDDSSDTGDASTAQQCIDDALAFLRTDTRDPSSSLVLCSFLSKLAHRAATTGAAGVAQAQVLLEESAALARRSRSDSSSEQLCEALVGLCVLEMKQQRVAKARELIREIDALPCAKMWREMYVIKDQLRAASEAEEREKHAVAERKRQELARQQSYHNSFAGWWDRWWFVLSVALVGAAVLLLQILELQLKVQQQQQQQGLAPSQPSLGSAHQP